MRQSPTESKSSSFKSGDSHCFKSSANRNSELEDSMNRATQQLKELAEFKTKATDKARSPQREEQKTGTHLSERGDVEIEYFKSDEPVAMLSEIQAQLEAAKFASIDNEQSIQEMSSNNKELEGLIGNLEQAIHDIYLVSSQPKYCKCLII